MKIKIFFMIILLSSLCFGQTDSMYIISKIDSLTNIITIINAAVYDLEIELIDQDSSKLKLINELDNLNTQIKRIKKKIDLNRRRNLRLNFDLEQDMDAFKDEFLTFKKSVDYFEFKTHYDKKELQEQLEDKFNKAAKERKKTSNDLRLTIQFLIIISLALLILLLILYLNIKKKISE